MNWKEHMVHVREVLEALRKAGLTAKPTKCEWGRSHVQYLGHIVGCGRLSVPEDRVTAMKEFKKPASKKQMRSFLGAMGYHRQFIEGYANFSALLTPATSKSAPIMCSGQSL